jgi:hypothetical protein
MDGPRKVDGEFWIVGESHNRRPGTLTVAPKHPPSLEVEGVLSSLLRQVKRGQSTVTYRPAEPTDATAYGPFLIQGIDNRGTPLTVIDAISVGWQLLGNQTQRFQSAQAVIGIHLESREHYFSSVRFRLQNLDAWRHFLRATESEHDASLTSGGLVSFSAPTARRLWLAVENVKGGSLRDLDRRFERPLVSLFNLVTGEGCEPLAIQVREGGPGTSWCDVYSGSLQGDPDQEGHGVDGWLLQLADLGIRNVAAWLDRVDLLGPLPPGVADLVGIGTISLESQVLQLTSIAEGLHRVLYPRQKRFKKEDVKKAQSLAADAVGKVYPELVESVKGLLGQLHQPSYSDRLARLATDAAPAIPGATGDIDKWRKLVTSARNQFAHRTKNEFLRPEGVDRYLVTALSLRWLLTATLLLQADIPMRVLAERFSVYQPYISFCSAAKEWQPDIYLNT